MPLKLNGSTSGYVIVDAPAVAGTTTISLPAVSGGSFVVSDSSGNVGIGTSTPSSYGNGLVVYNSGTGVVRSYGGTVGAYMFASSSGGVAATGTETNHPFAFYTNNSERARIDTSGNVAVGTTNTSFGKFTLVCSGTSRTTGLAITPSGDLGDGLRLYCDGTNNPNGIIENVWDSSGPILYKDIFLNPNGGNFLVGKTTTAETTAGVCFSTSVNNIGLSSGNYFIINYVPGGSSTMIDFRTAGASKGSISQNGSNVAYNTSSDYRLKYNVEPLKTGLSTISALNPVTYQWIDSDINGEGFIAHELQSVIPLAVTGEKDDVDEEGNIKPQGVDYSKIVVHLVAAIQELKAEIDALKAKVGS